MPTSIHAEAQGLSAPLAKLGGWTAFFQATTVIFAVVGYFIWPHIFSDHDGKMVLEGILAAPGAYFMKLDPIVLIGTLLQMPVYLGLWVVLKKEHAAGALLALVLGGLSTVASLTTRPIRELYYLAWRYEVASSLEQKNTLIAASESLLSMFHGTAWAVSVMLGGFSSILFFWLMRRSVHFQKTTAWAMLIAGIGAVVVLVPVIGILALFLLATLGGIVASIFCGIDLLRFSKVEPT